MKAAKTILLAGMVFLIVISLTACSTADSSASASRVVEDYFQALVEKDLNQMINLSCSTWEEQARNEYSSFAAVDLKLQDLKCQTSSQENNAAVVTCSGKMIASYGAENLEIDIAEQTYQVIQEAGEWHMCGYTP